MTRSQAAYGQGMGKGCTVLVPYDDVRRVPNSMPTAVGQIPDR